MKINRTLLNNKVIELEDKIRKLYQDQKANGARIEKALYMHQYRAHADALKTILDAIEEKK
jgi:hypothetical protein